jgi:hypothetical protein
MEEEEGRIVLKWDSHNNDLLKLLHSQRKVNVYFTDNYYSSLIFKFIVLFKRKFGETFHCVGFRKISLINLLLLTLNEAGFVFYNSQS